MRWLPIVLVGVGCDEDPADGTVTDPPVDTGSTTVPCDNVVLAQEPEAGATDVSLAGIVTFTLAEPDATAVVTVSDAAGAEVPGLSTVDGAGVRWTADAQLANDTGYTATLSHACGVASTSWTTEPVPVVEVLDPTGVAFSIDLADGDWVEPAGIGDLLASQLGDAQLFVEATGASLVGPEMTLDMLVARGSVDGQDLCSPTTPVPGVAYLDPDFELLTSSLFIRFGTYDIELQDIELTGSFAPDLSRIGNVQFGGTIDTRPLGPAFELGDEPGAVCQLVATFGVSCTACPSGVGPFCLDVRVDNLMAPAVGGLSLQERTPADIEVDPLCD